MQNAEFMRSEYLFCLSEVNVETVSQSFDAFAAPVVFLRFDCITPNPWTSVVLTNLIASTMLKGAWVGKEQFVTSSITIAVSTIDKSSDTQ